MEEKLLKIINHYGVIHQLKYFQSEVFEFNEAVITLEKTEEESCRSHVCNARIESERQHIAEELADVEVMLLQLKEYYHIDGKDILKIMNEKIDRQLERISKGEQHD